MDRVHAAEVSRSRIKPEVSDIVSESDLSECPWDLISDQNSEYDVAERQLGQHELAAAEEATPEADLGVAQMLERLNLNHLRAQFEEDQVSLARYAPF